MVMTDIVLAVSFFEMQNARDALSYYDSSARSAIENSFYSVMASTIFILVIGLLNYKNGNQLFKGAKLAITNPEDVIGKFFKLKPMFISLIYNAILCGAIGSGVESTQITIGLMGLIGVIFGFYVRFYILKHEYLLAQSASQNAPPSQYAPSTPNRR